MGANRLKFLMIVFLLKLFSWHPTASASPLPCLSSSNQCVQQLTEKAIANSPKLKQSESRIALIEQRLAVTEERIDYTSKKKWTNYISTDPVNIIQNLFGGGGVQRDNLAIASLEVRTTCNDPKS